MEDPTTGAATMLGTGELVNKYPLVVGTEYHLPFLLLAEGKGENVEGEIYEIDDQKLDWLDEFESHPDFYRRQLAQVKVAGEEFQVNGKMVTPGQVCQCWVYFLPKFKPKMLNLKMLKTYSSLSGEHPPYNTSEEVESLDDV
ncbi:gamma-glutamylaminecyclotransferase [Plakobranchus ocellatus]|uniref:Gamma-glutamylcyclotransferase family protein n=1 Tax=Plakobranchus ocellatus TaxID=259542 RepID=A0AAV4BLX0_9GAST|nr:gamma-glutamylaminecyclotransferase [Plakobranchus ocellatus]